MRPSRAASAALEFEISDLQKHSLDAILDGRGSEPFDIVEALQDVQDLLGHLPEEVLRRISVSFSAPLIEVFRLANFYKAFSLKPRGRHLLTVCTGTACHVRGARGLLDEVMDQLQIEPGETTDDRLFTLETVNCLGACALGPVLVCDREYHDHMTPAKLRAFLAAVREADHERFGEADAGQLEVAPNA